MSDVMIRGTLEQAPYLRRLKDMGDDTFAEVVAIGAQEDEGCEVYRNLSLLATGQVIKGTPGQLYGYFLTNRDASNEHVIKLYNQATAPSHTDTPYMTIPLGAGKAANLDLVHGIPFSAGISIRATTELADNGATAPDANDVVVDIWFK